VRAIPRKWTNSKGINVDSEKSANFAMNRLRKEVGLFVYKPKKNNKKYNSKKR